MSNLLPQPTGSATGNPRNKTALKPGHSLMDWIRLRGDLAGTKGVVTPVTLAELKKHNKKNDAWLAIRGKVYNVTRYMDFHPGGVEELMKGVGMDATKVFDDVHAWVNYDQMLSKCYIGPLRAAPGSPPPASLFAAPSSSSAGKIVSSSSSSKLSAGSGLTANGFRLPFSLSANNFISKSSAENAKAKEEEEEEETVEIIPRFDWIQKTSDLVIIFYTRAFCNPAAVIEYLGGGQVEVKLLLERTTYLVKFALTESVKWPCSIRNVIETGKLEITFAKAESKLWANYGTMEMTKVTEIDVKVYDYNVEGCWPINHDSYGLQLKTTANNLMYLPIGYHVSITSRVNEKEVTRSYTPIPNSFLEQPSDNTCISLLIKSYENGTLSRHLCQRSPLVQGLQISSPKGSFSMAKLRSHTRVAFFAAGSGLTPFLGIVDHLISSKQINQFEFVKLFYFNKTESDIWCRNKLEAMARSESKFQVIHTLSEADKSWDGARGRVSRELIAAIAGPCGEDAVTFIAVCGPPAFNRQIAEYTSDVGFPATSQHIFQG